MSNSAKVIVPITREEQVIAKQYLVRGELGLLERGFTSDEIQEFLSRPEIQTFLRQIYEDYVEKDARRDRVKYFALSELERLISPAIAIVARAVAGLNLPASIDDAHIDKMPPSEQQYNAAMGVLDRLGIKVANKGASDIVVNPVTALNNLSINVNEGVLEDSVSIERVLSLVDTVMSKMKKAAQSQMDAEGRSVIEVKRLPDKTQIESSHDRLSELKSDTKKDNNGKTKKKRRSKRTGNG